MGSKGMSKYSSITVREAMNKIASNNYVLPAIQRKFESVISTL